MRRFRTHTRSHARSAEALRGEPTQRCPPLQPPRPLSRASCREARPGGHRVSAGRRWVTFMTRGAKSSLSRWRCAETVVTPFFGIQPCSRARPPAGCSGSYCGCIHRSAPGGSRRRRERRVVVCGLCCAPGTVTGRSFLISDSSFGVVARIVPIVAVRTRSHHLRVSGDALPLAAKGSEGTKDRRSRYERKQVKRAPLVWPVSRGRRIGRAAGGN